MPGSWLSQYSFRNAGSVASFWVTSNWSGVSFFLSSSCDGLAYCVIVPFPPLEALAAASGVDCCAHPTSKKMRMDFVRLRWITGFASSAENGSFSTVIRCRRREDVSGVGERKTEGRNQKSEELSNSGFCLLVSGFRSSLHVRNTSSRGDWTLNARLVPRGAAPGLGQLDRGGRAVGAAALVRDVDPEGRRRRDRARGEGGRIGADRVGGVAEHTLVPLVMQ